MKNSEVAKSEFNHLCGQLFSMQFHPKDVRAMALCCGVAPEKCLIIQTPNVYNPRTDHAEGDSVTVRYVDDGIVYGFRSEILSHVLNPVRLLFIELPKNVEEFELRSTKRVDTVIKTVLAKGDFKLDGIILNLSTGGCKIAIPREYDPVTGDEMILWEEIALTRGDGVSLSFSVTRGIKTDDVDSTVLLEDVRCWIRRVESDERNFRMNLEFDKEQVDVVAHIDGYVESILRVLPS